MEKNEKKVNNLECFLNNVPMLACWIQTTRHKCSFVV